MSGVDQVAGHLADHLAAGVAEQLARGMGTQGPAGGIEDLEPLGHVLADGVQAATGGQGQAGPKGEAARCDSGMGCLRVA